MIDLYMWGTGNGYRAAIALAESGLAHKVHKVDLTKGENKQPEYLKINPAGLIPALVDSDGPGGKPVTMAQSGAILLYAAEKSGKMVPKDPMRRVAALHWMMQGCSDVAVTSGAIFALENFVPEKHPSDIEFFKKRLTGFFGHVDARLAGREFLADEFSLADLALYPVVNARKALAEGLPNLEAWRVRMAARPGVQKGMAA
jgi:GSH-dependent disulfide-bond oxidoreductase